MNNVIQIRNMNERKVRSVIYWVELLKNLRSTRFLLRACSVSFYAHLFGKFCRLLRQKYLPYVSMSAYFFLVIDKITLENPHIKRY